MLGELSISMRPLEELTGSEMGTFMHASEGEMVCESINPKIPYFNAPIYLENKVRHRSHFAGVHLTRIDGDRED